MNVITSPWFSTVQFKNTETESEALPLKRENKVCLLPQEV